MERSEFIELCENGVFTTGGFINACERLFDNIRGKRNRKSKAAEFAEKLNLIYYDYEIHEGQLIVRTISYNYGTIHYPDWRRKLEIVQIARKTKKLYIGTCGERVRKGEIIYKGERQPLFGFPY